MLARHTRSACTGQRELEGKTVPPGPFNDVRQVGEETECVEGIASDLGHSPGDQKKHHALFVLDLQIRESHSVVQPRALCPVR